MIREKLFNVDPYVDFPLDQYPGDLQGWDSTHPFFERLITALRPSVIIEVGSWKGSSAIHMAGLCKAANIRTEIVCVDTWLGSPEHMMNARNDYFESLRHRNGFPTLFYTFMSNVVRAGHQDVITPFPIASESAAVVLRHLGVKAELVYIDAAHQYASALRDMRDFWTILAPDGAMLCDDYGSWKGVTKAACEFAASVERPLYGSWGKAIIPKGEKVRLQLDLRAIGKGDTRTHDQAVLN